ncbi:MAG: hypothetical protein K1060chlam2_00657 [Chlamydiae bacterium]|nr:hypothetical protein [Chlamydiota bacterium]
MNPWDTQKLTTTEITETTESESDSLDLLVEDGSSACLFNPSLSVISVFSVVFFSPTRYFKSSGGKPEPQEISSSKSFASMIDQLAEAI